MYVCEEGQHSSSHRLVSADYIFHVRNGSKCKPDIFNSNFLVCGFNLGRMFISLISSGDIAFPSAKFTYTSSTSITNH